MATSELGKNQIQPAAQPLSTFITPNMVNPARPAAPERVGDRAGFSLVSTGSRGNIENQNGGIALAQALEGFNKNITEVVGKGLGLYASSEYQKGQSEAFKASLLAQRQMQEGGKQYAADNRELALKDPIAGMAMDTVNPFRSAGRRNALSQVAGQQVSGALELAYAKNRNELARLAPDDPRINEIKAEAVDSILGRYGLTEDDPGFIDYVLPQLNRGWERITAQQQADRAEWQKSTMLTTLPLTLAGKIKEARRQGATAAQAAAMATKALDDETDTLGLPGEKLEMAKKVAEKLWRQAMTKDGDGNRDTELLEVVLGIEIGEPTPNGWRPTVASLFAEEIEDRQATLETREWEQQQRGREQASREFDSDVSAALVGMEDGPEKQQTIAEFLDSDDPKYAGLDRGERMDIVLRADRKAGELDGLAYNPDDNEAWLLDQEEKYGNAWDPAAAMEEFREREAAIPEGPQREEFRRRFLSLREKKNREQGEMPNAAINKSVNDRIRLNIEREYPGMGVELQRAQAAGVDIGAYLANKGGDAAASAARQRSAYTRHIYAALGAARAKKGGPLTPLEEQETIDRALDEYGKSNPKAAAAALFPGGVVSGAPTSVPGGKNPAPAAAAAPAAGGSPKTGGKPAAPAKPTFGISRIQDAPVDRLRNWRSDPIVDPQSLVDMTGQVLNGGDYPRQIKAAARKAGTTPGRFVVDQIKLQGPDFMQLKPDQEKRLLRQGQERASAQRYADGVAPTVSRRPDAPEQGILARAGMWALNALTGTAPAYAGTNGGSWSVRGGGSSDGAYLQGNIGPTSTGAHFDVKKLSGGKYFDRDALDNFVEVNGKPLSSGVTVAGGTFAGHQGRNSHGWDYAFGEGRYAATLKNGAKWLDGKPTEHGEARRFQLPNGDIYQFLHGSFEAKPRSTRSRSTRASAAPKGPEGFRQVVQSARVAGAKFPELVAAMWAIESGYGSKPSGKNNYWNQKGKGTAVNTVEYSGGKAGAVRDQFLNFNSWTEGLDYLVTRWFKNFKGFRGINNARNLNEAMSMLVQQGYATDPNYIPKLRRIMRERGVRI